MTGGRAPVDLRHALATLDPLPGELVRVAEELPARYGVSAHYARWAARPPRRPPAPAPRCCSTGYAPRTAPPGPC